MLNSDVELDETYESVLRNFLGKRLCGFTTQKESACFQFEEGYEIKLSADVDFYESSDELFMLFDRDKNLVTSFSVENGLEIEAIVEKGSESV